MALNDLQSVQTLALETLVGLESKNDDGNAENTEFSGGKRTEKTSNRLIHPYLVYYL